MTVSKAVALRIYELLEKKKMKLYNLEQASGIWHGTMACIVGERTKTITLTTIIKIAKGFKMTMQEFLNSPLFSSENLDVE